MRRSVAGNDAMEGLGATPACVGGGASCGGQTGRIAPQQGAGGGGYVVGGQRRRGSAGTHGSTLTLDMKISQCLTPMIGTAS